jgi:hypothetical protein
MFGVPGWEKKEEEMEELLAPVLAVLNQTHEFRARLNTFVTLFGGEHVQCDGAVNQVRWYGTAGFALFFSGLKDGDAPTPPELLGAVPRFNGSTYAVYRASTLPVGATFRDGKREFVVVCNETRGKLLYHRMLFLALLREVVEKMKKG